MTGFSNLGRAAGFAGVGSDGQPEGDLTGSYPNPLVVGIWDNPVDPRLPSNGDTLIYNGGEWIPTPSPASTTVFQGVWDANTNTPDIANYPGLSDGYVWIVGVSGNTNVGGISTWDLGDYAVYSGGNWYRLSNSSFGWRLSGNAGTNPTVNFVGTTDAHEFSIRANSVEGLRIHTTGDVTAAQSIEVVHNITGSNAKLLGDLAVCGGNIKTNSSNFNLLVGATGRINMGNSTATNWISGTTQFPQGISGSHTKLVDGTSAFIACTGILVSTASNGAVKFTMSNTGSAGTYGSTFQVPVFSTDDQGRVTSALNTSIQIDESQVTNLLSDLTSSYNSVSNLSSSLASEKANKITTISAGIGLTGGGDLSANRTISLENTGSAGTYGSASSIPVFSTDAQGRVTAVSPVSVQISESQVTNLLADLTSSYNSITNLSSSLAAEKANKTTSINTGLGLTGGGNLSADRTFAINDSVVATISGSTFTGAVKFNAGLSGSLTKLVDGTSAFIGGTGIQIASASNGAVTITMANTGSAGTYGSASSIPVFSTDAQGRVTAVTDTSIAINASQVVAGTFPSSVSVQNIYQNVTSQVSGGSSPLAYGEVIYFTTSGGSAASPAINRASAASAATAATTIGLVSSTTIPNGTSGQIITRGVLVGNPLGSPPYLNTNSFTQGDLLYVDPTTPGALTNVRPSYPNFAIPVGIVIVKNQYTGAIYVDPSVGYNAADIVKIPAPSAKRTESAPGTTSILSSWFNGPPAISYLALDFSGAGNVTLNAGPIQAQTSADYGRILWIHNVSTKTVTFNSGGTTYLSGGVNLVLQPNSLVQFMWSFVGGGVGRWLQMGSPITVS